MPKPLLTVSEVAQWIRVKEATLRKWVCYKRIPYLKVGRHVCFEVGAVEQWLHRGETSTADEEIRPQ
ncbi:MAG TPA: excisionase family DNA-binding protein [Elusimicrobiota bacterium]|nr:excisionase family DNA-binding protein [Elusimicrobiota bacterium]